MIFYETSYSSFQNKFLLSNHHILGPLLGFGKGISDSLCFHGALLEEADKYTGNFDPL